MGRRRQRQELAVYIGRTRVGTHTRHPDGATEFRYDPDWLGAHGRFPVSLSLPLAERIYQGDDIHPYFGGLLPDDPEVRRTIAAREGAASARDFDLLAAIGRDCVGALQFLPEGEIPADPRQMIADPIDEATIGERIAHLGERPLGLGGDDFRLSLAGMQDKTALLWQDGRWWVPRGATPTSHILKPAPTTGPGGADFSTLPWNEWTCLTLFQALGLPAAASRVERFGGRWTLVVERFDRQWRDGVLYRIPQEDCCQALGVPPERKYQAEGGPGMVDLLDLLHGSRNVETDQQILVEAQAVFWLLSAIDGHAKNFSIGLGPDGFSLRPLYDVISSAPYPRAFPPEKARLAMSLGKRRRYEVASIFPRHFLQTATQAGFPTDWADALLAGLSGRLDAALHSVAVQARGLDAPETIVTPILEAVAHRKGRLPAPDHG
ncbi:MAG: type II toxin-antitoxin system HipA family toxin [Pseudomonadota bacterium]